MADKVKIFLDAGHGGSDSGAVLGKRHEADDVLRLVLAVGKKLTSGYSNVSVGYSRKTDIYESPTKKAQDSNNFGADYFFSFHRNASNGKVKGFETEYQSRSTYKDGVMKDIKAEMKKIGFTLRADAKRVPGVNGLAVLRLTNAPALLFEIGFIDNKTDNAIFDNKFNEIVNAFVKVIAKWCGLKKKTTEKVVSVPIQSVSISASFREGSYNKTVKITKDNHVRSGRGAQYKKLGLLKKGQKVKVLYILKNSAGNLWGSIDYGNDVGYICLNYAEEI